MKNLVLPLIIIIVVALWAISGFVLIDYPDRGTIGDMFGAVNSLFSGLAFAGLIYTILLQKNELGLQRKELEYTRVELRGQKETMQAQNEQLAHQAFEGTFFQMLKQHNELLKSITLTSCNPANLDLTVLSGADCFKKSWATYCGAFTVKSENIDLASREIRVKEAFLRLWNEFEGDFSHYFRSLYNVMKFVHNSDVENKKLYTNIVRAQISKFELIVIFYSGIYHSESKFTPLIEEYAFLKHLSCKLIFSDLDFQFYQSTAFGGDYPEVSPES